MTRPKSFFDRFRTGSGRALIGFPGGPLAFASRKSETASVKKVRRKPKPDDLERRLIMADQIGQLPELLVGYLPRLSTHHSFALAEASVLAIELGVTIFHLLDAGAVIDGLSKEDLDEFREDVSSLKNEDKIIGQQAVRAPPPRAGTQPSVKAPPQKSSATTAVETAREEIERMLREAG